MNGGTSVTYVSTNTYNLTGFSTLQAGTAVDTFNVQANASGNLRGGLGNDIFNLNASLTGSISGEGDNDTLAGTQVDAVTLVGSVDSGTEDSLSGGFSSIETINAAAGGGTLTGLDVDATWALGATRTYTANAQTLTFTNFTVLQGGNGVDTFNVTSTVAAPGLTLNGGQGNDQYLLSAALTGTIDGQQGSDTISRAALNTANTWVVNGANAGTVTGLTGSFTGVENFIGGTGADTFRIDPSGSLSGNIDGNTGTDLLDYSNLTAVQVPAGVQVNLQLGTASLIGGAVQAIENVTGSQANDTLVGNSQNNSLNGFDGNDTITGAAGNDTITGGSGTDTLLESFTGIVTLTNTSFNGNGADTLSAIEAADLTGSVGNDQLTINFTGQMTANGAGGNDVLVGPNANASWNLTTGTLTTANLSASFSQFEEYQGGSLVDTFRVDVGGASGVVRGGLGADLFDLQGLLTGSLNGEGGADQLTGPDAGAQWQLNGIHAGTASFITAGFVQVEIVQGGSGVDQFEFVSTGATSTVRGGSGNDQFELNGLLIGSIDGEAGDDQLFGPLVTNVTLTAALPNGYTGTEGDITGGFTGLDYLIAGTTASVLTGINTISDWDINGVSTYTTAGVTLRFEQFYTLNGGTQADSFVVHGSIGDADQRIQGNAGVDQITLSGATINLSGTNGLTLSAESLTLTGSSVQTVDGNQAYVGPLTLQQSILTTTGQGAVQLSNDVVVQGLGRSVINGTLQLGTITTRTFTVDNVTGDEQGDLVINANIAASTAGVVKLGAGELVYEGTASYTGTTQVNAGTLLVNGTLVNGTAVTDVTVGNGAILGGQGTIQGNTRMLVGSRLSAGSPVSNTGRLNTANITFAAGAEFVAQVNADTTQGADYDQMNVTGAVDISNVTLVTSGLIPRVSQREIVLIRNDGTDAIVGTFAGLAEASIVNINGVNFRLSYIGGDGNDVILSADTYVTLISGDVMVRDIAAASDDRLVWQADVANQRYIIFDTDVTRVLTTDIAGATGNGTNSIAIPFVQATQELRVETLAGQDQLTVDYSLGLFANVIRFDGGIPTPGNPGDQLLLVGGGPFNAVQYQFIDEHSGSINVTGNAALHFQAVEPITDQLNAVNRRFDFSAADDQITVGQATAIGYNTIDSNFANRVLFANPTGSLTIGGGQGNDQITVSTLDMTMSAGVNVNVEGGAGTNQLTVATPDQALAASRYRFAGFVFDQTRTPDSVTALPLGALAGGQGVVVTAGVGAATGIVGFPATPNAGFDPNLTIGHQLTGASGARAINLPSGNLGNQVRAGIELSWSNAGSRLVNEAGDDLVIYDSSSNPTGPDAFMVQVLSGGNWSRWRFETADSRETYVGSPTAGAFATAFDLADFGLAAGATVDAVRIVTMNANDRIEGSGREITAGSNTFVGQGFVLVNDGGATSDTQPDPGGMASFDLFGNATFDVDRYMSQRCIRRLDRQPIAWCCKGIPLQPKLKPLPGQRSRIQVSAR